MRKGYWIATFVFFILTTLGAFYHELWADEIIPWQIAKSSSSLWNLYEHYQYEGHTFIWYAMVWGVHHTVGSLIYMQLTHILLASSAIIIFLKYVPFSTTEKLLYIFGYFMFYEYAVISRPYILGVLSVFAISVFLQKSNASIKYLYYASISIFALANTSLYGIVLSFAYVPVICIRIWKNMGIKEGILLPFVMFLGITLAFYQVLPPADGGFVNSEWRFYFDGNLFVDVADQIFTAYIPIPDFTELSSWNSNFFITCFHNDYYKYSVAIFSIFMVLAVGYYLKPNKEALFIYLVATLGILSFAYLKYKGTLRHHGYLYIILVACIWQYKSSSAFPKAPKTIKDKLLKASFSIVLLCHFLAGAYSYIKDLLLPFDLTESMVAYINKESLDSMPMITDNVSYAGFLDKPVYFAEKMEFANHYTLNNKRADVNNNEHLFLSLINEVVQQSDSNVLLAWSRRLSFADVSMGIKELAFKKGCIRTPIPFVLYEVDRDKFLANHNENKNRARAYLSSAKKYSKKGETDKAISMLEKAISLDHEIDSINYEIGTYYLNKSQIDKAVFFLKQELLNNGTHEDAHFNLAIAYLQSGQYVFAVNELKELVILNGAHEDAHNLLAIIYAKTNSTIQYNEQLETIDSLKLTISNELRNIINATQ